MPTHDIDEWVNVPFVEAIRLSNTRNVILPDVYYGKIPNFVRSQTFSIAGVTRIDQLQSAINNLNKLVENGGTFADFQGAVLMGDVDLELPKHRLELIFRNAMQTAYNRGRCEKFALTNDTRPYRLYSAINDSRVRATHLAMDNYIAHYTADVWAIWTPQNGHRCRCTLISLTERQAQRRGISKEAPTVMPDAEWDYSVCENPHEGMNRAIDNKKNIAPELVNDVQQFKPKPRKTLDELIELGKEKRKIIVENVNLKKEKDKIIVKEIEVNGEKIIVPVKEIEIADFDNDFKTELLDELNKVRPTLKPAVLENKGPMVDIVEEVSQNFPNKWTTRADNFGPLYAEPSINRSFIANISPELAGKTATLGPFGNMELVAFAGYLVANSERSATHEYSHRLQAAIPELDDYFQQLHINRTANDQLKSLKSVTGDNYSDNEVFREDKYINSYMGKEYKSGYFLGQAGAIELMPMTYEIIFNPSNNINVKYLHDYDPELLDLALGLLFDYDL